jgi:cytochrome c556
MEWIEEIVMKVTASRCLIALAVPVAIAGVLTARAQDDAKAARRSQFMRQKLEYAKGALEGLAVEDYGRIARSARDLKALSQAAEWEVPTIPNVDEYLPYTAEFQRVADEMMKKARAGNLDGATLAYVQMTMSCVKCHKYVRDLAK